jgi:4-hydroxy-tetrahydrodipicolinate synthase
MTNDQFDLARLATVQLVPLTPFSPDGKRVLSEALDRQVREAFAAGIRVFIPAAGTGEFHSLTAAEVIECTRITRRAAGGEATVVTPVGLSLEYALVVGRAAEKAGADALLVMPPVHPYLSDAGFGDYLRALASEVPLPLLAYKKGPVPSDQLLGEMGEEGVLVGVKYSVNDLDAFARFADRYGGKLGLYCGTAERFAPFFMLAGAKGYTTGAGNLCPRLTLAMFRALSSGDTAEAFRLLRLIRPIEDYRAHDGDSYNISMLKFGMTLLGRDVGPPRPPIRRLTSDEQNEIRKLLEPILKEEQERARFMLRETAAL